MIDTINKTLKKRGYNIQINNIIDKLDEGCYILYLCTKKINISDNSIQIRYLHRLEPKTTFVFNSQTYNNIDEIEQTEDHYLKKFNYVLPYISGNIHLSIDKDIVAMCYEIIAYVNDDFIFPLLD